MFIYLFDWLSINTFYIHQGSNVIHARNHGIVLNPIMKYLPTFSSIFKTLPFDLRLPQIVLHLPEMRFTCVYLEYRKPRFVGFSRTYRFQERSLLHQSCLEDEVIKELHFSDSSSTVYHNRNPLTLGWSPSIVKASRQDSCSQIRYSLLSP